jgi:hypothetical protein
VGTLAACGDGDGGYGYAHCEGVDGSTPRWAACDIPPPPVPRVRYCWDADNDRACQNACDVCPARGYPDAPQDPHWRVAQNETDCPADCDDKNTAAHRRDAGEICDGYDNNCDGQRDEGLKSCGPWTATGDKCTYTGPVKALTFNEAAAPVDGLLGGADWRPPDGPPKGWALVQLVFDFSNEGSCATAPPMSVECDPPGYCYWQMPNGEQGPESMLISAADFSEGRQRLLVVLPTTVVRLRKRSEFGAACKRHLQSRFESIRPVDPYCVP